MRTFCAAISTLILLLVAHPANAQSFNNGSFEELTPGTFVPDLFDRMETATAEGWNVVSGSPD